MFWVRSVYFNVRNILLKSGTFPPGHSVFTRRFYAVAYSLEPPHVENNATQKLFINLT